MIQRSEAQTFREHARILAMQIGLHPAAMAIGIKPERIRQWNKRYNWQISAIRGNTRSSNRDLDLAAESRRVTEPLNALANILALEGDRTRSAMARSARRAFEYCDELTTEQLHEMPRAIALEKHGRNASVAHGWSNATQNVAVQLNVALPGKEEREEMRSIDAKLDLIASKLQH